MNRRAFMFGLVLLVFVAPPLVSVASAQDTFAGVERIVAVGDIHSDYDRLTDVLRTAKVIDEATAWTGGKTHLVLNGDFLDRGPASGKVMDLLMALEPQAERAGGKVHALIGNHEAMNVYGDLRYVSKEDYSAYRVMAPTLPDRKGQGGVVPDPSFVQGLRIPHPPGWQEHRLFFQPDGKYGQWLRRKNSIVRINDLLFVHGGISPQYLSATRAEINREIQAELQDFSKLPGGMALANDGPLWYRGYAELSERKKGYADHLDKVLQTHGVRHIVVGHTPAVAILPRFGGRVILIDVGLSQYYGGPPAFLLVEKEKYYAVHRGQRFNLPVDGGDVLQYLQRVADLEPANSRLRKTMGKVR
jgi:hypothetical protein